MNIEISSLPIDGTLPLFKTVSGYDTQQAGFIDAAENYYCEPTVETVGSFRMASTRTASAYRGVIHELLSRDTEGVLDAATNFTVQSQADRLAQLSGFAAYEQIVDLTLYRAELKEWMQDRVIDTGSFAAIEDELTTMQLQMLEDERVAIARFIRTQYEAQAAWQNHVTR